MQIIKIDNQSDVLQYYISTSSTFEFEVPKIYIIAIMSN